MSYTVRTFHHNRNPWELAEWLNTREAEGLQLVGVVGTNWYVFAERGNPNQGEVNQ